MMFQATLSTLVVRFPRAVSGTGTVGEAAPSLWGGAVLRVAHRGCVGTLRWAQSSTAFREVGLQGVFGVHVGPGLSPHLHPRVCSLGAQPWVSAPSTLCTKAASSGRKRAVASPPLPRAPLQGPDPQPRGEGSAPAPTPLACAGTFPLCSFWGYGPWWSVKWALGRESGTGRVELLEGGGGWRASAARASVPGVIPGPTIVALRSPNDCPGATGQREEADTPGPADLPTRSRHVGPDGPRAPWWGQTGAASVCPAPPPERPGPGRSGRGRVPEPGARPALRRRSRKCECAGRHRRDCTPRLASPQRGPWAATP